MMEAHLWSNFEMNLFSLIIVLFHHALRYVKIKFWGQWIPKISHDQDNLILSMAEGLSIFADYFSH